jgi:hypothetical protein
MAGDLAGVAIEKKIVVPFLYDFPIFLGCSIVSLDDRMSLASRVEYPTERWPTSSIQNKTMFSSVSDRASPRNAIDTGLLSGKYGANWQTG